VFLSGTIKYLLTMTEMFRK